MIYTGAKVYVSGAGLRAVDVRVERGCIAQIGENLQGDKQALSGYLIPGMIDLHTHGYAGSDVMQGESAVRAMSAAYARRGVTAFLPTTVNAPVAETHAALAGVSRAMKDPPGARVLGAHVEGPFINQRVKGALLADSILPPSAEALRELLGGFGEIVRLLTLAPELPGAAETIAAAREMGIAVSAGHTLMTYEQAVGAIDMGIEHFTHLFNATTPLHHREPGAAVAALLDGRATVQLIPDGVHVHPAMLKLAARLLPDGICLITDSMMAAGLGDGNYELGGQKVIVAGGEARLPEGNLAGSMLTMDEALRRMVRFCGLPLEQVIPMSGEIPARALGLCDAGRIAPGCKADLCLLSEELMPEATWIGGVCVCAR